MQSLPTFNPKHAVMHDQACELRSLIARRVSAAAEGSVKGRRCHTIAIAGGKGGVGKSVLAVNLAIALAKQGSQVGLFDASPHLGQVEMLCGISRYWNLSHVTRSGRRLEQVVQKGPAGVHILAGGSGLIQQDLVTSTQQQSLFASLQSFEENLDWLIVDGSGGTIEMVQRLAAAADELLILSTPEPTAIVEAYATVKSLARVAGGRLGVLVNQSDSHSQSQQILDRLQQASQSFLHLDLHRIGSIARDPHVVQSVHSRVPLIIQTPTCESAVAVDELAQRWNQTRWSVTGNQFFFRLWSHSELARAESFSTT